MPLRHRLTRLIRRRSRVPAASPGTIQPPEGALLSRAASELAAAGTTGGTVGVMVVEIDHYRERVERLDRAERVAVLAELGRRIGAVGPGCIRLDGAVFGLVLPRSHRWSMETALRLAQRVQAAVADPLPTGPGSLYLKAGVGFCLSDRMEEAEEAATAEALLQGAETALIEAQRRAPAAIRSYSHSMRTRVATRARLAEEFGVALHAGEIEAHFQPQVAAPTGMVTGCEALARWRHPVQGLIPPAEFLPAVDAAGMMDKLGERILDLALDALQDWDRAGLDVPRVSVNFGPQDLCRAHLADQIAFKLDARDLDPGRLAVEVLESVVAPGTDDLIVRNLADLARLGCGCELDDFGTGYASISSIRRFSISRIKIDRSFVIGLTEDADQQSMVSAMIGMAHELGLETLAEGVETEAERARLRELGCAHLQGYLIARPMPLAETTAWLASDRPMEVVPLQRRGG